MISFIFTLIFLGAALFGLYKLHKKITFRRPLILNSDSVVVITGGCDGIGRLTVLDLARRYQCKLVVVDIQAQKFAELKKQVYSIGSQIQCLECDLSKVQQMDKVINQIKSKYSQIDVLVNNAGIAFQKQLQIASSYQKNLKTLQVNYLAPCHLFVQLLDNLKGHVVTIASIASIIRGNHLSSYVASKAAIYAFFNCARVQLHTKKPNVTMSLVCPWAIDTGMFEGFRTKLQRIIPLLKPADVTQVIHETIIHRPQVVWIPSYVGFLSKLVNLLPDFYLDRIYKWADSSEYTNNRQKANL